MNAEIISTLFWYDRAQAGLAVLNIGGKKETVWFRNSDSVDDLEKIDRTRFNNLTYEEITAKLENEGRMRFVLNILKKVPNDCPLYLMCDPNNYDRFSFIKEGDDPTVKTDWLIDWNDKIYFFRRNIKTKQLNNKFNYKKIKPFKILRKLLNINYKLLLP